MLIINILIYRYLKSISFILLFNCFTSQGNHVFINPTKNKFAKRGELVCIQNEFLTHRLGTSADLHRSNFMTLIRPISSKKLTSYTDI